MIDHRSVRPNTARFLELATQRPVLPELTILLLSRHLNHSGLVYYPCRTVALLHDANDPGLISLLLLNVFAVGSGLFARQADQQTARRLCTHALEYTKGATGRENRVHFQTGDKKTSRVRVPIYINIYIKYRAGLQSSIIFSTLYRVSSRLVFNYVNHRTF